MNHVTHRGTATNLCWPAEWLDVFTPSPRDTNSMSRTLFFFFFLRFFFLCKRKGRLGPSVCTDLPASASADVYKLAWQATKYMPITAGEMTGLPLSMLFPSRTSWMAQSPDAAPCSGMPPAHGSSAAGTGSQLQLCWAWPVAAVVERCGEPQRACMGTPSWGGTWVCMGKKGVGYTTCLHAIPSGNGTWGWAIVLGTCPQKLSEDFGQETLPPFSQMAKSEHKAVK